MMLRKLILLALCSGVTACASVPDVNTAINTPYTNLAQPEIIGANGPLNKHQSQKALEKLKSESHDTALLQRHLAVEQEISGTPLIYGNRSKILQNGPETFRAKFKAIQQAKDTINLEYFIIEDIEIDGLKLSELLIQKRQEGVAINLIYDSYGSALSDDTFFQGLNEAGIKLVSFNPLNPLDARNVFAPNDRDHRKLLIVDGALAIMGGVNLSTSYISSPFGPSIINESPDTIVRDTDIEIEGPAVALLQLLFFDQWAKQHGPQIEERYYFPLIPSQGDEIMRIIGSTPEDIIPRYYATLLSAIRHAEKNIWLTTAFFVPTDQALQDIINAAHRGVDVKLLVPGKTDPAVAHAVQQSHYDALLEAGVKIYENQSEELHAKSAVIDGIWSSIGSSNIDYRSVLFNDEVDIVILGKKTGQEFEKMFIDDINKARQIDRTEWENRSFFDRMNENFSLIWQTLL